MGTLEDYDAFLQFYHRRMREAWYQAFWIRVRIWIWDHELSLVLISVGSILGILWYITEIL